MAEIEGETGELWMVGESGEIMGLIYILIIFIWG